MIVCIYILYGQAILSSKYSEWFVSLSGEVFEGGLLLEEQKSKQYQSLT